MMGVNKQHVKGALHRNHSLCSVKLEALATRAEENGADRQATNSNYPAEPRTIWRRRKKSGEGGEKRRELKRREASAK
jgi:hypothetical protein